MANIRQTIPSYSAGISEQPDHLKFPGQVKNAVNTVPDITKGLFKRPGARRVGTDKLPNVQTGGSFFHYYRDDNEGSYIGQVAPNGTLRVWKASGRNAGAEQTVAYGGRPWHTDDDYVAGVRVQNANKVYEAQTDIDNTVAAPTHSSGTTNNWLFIETTAAAQTTVQNYLQTDAATPENIQFLSINDTTFVSNRDQTAARKQYTTVGTTGTTQARPSGEEHCAFIELTRTENGRQYAANIYDSSSTGNLTTVKRATKIKITGNSFDESDGSGSCPGIGTEVYVATAKGSYSSVDNIEHIKNQAGSTLTSGRTNLVFRATALGQQGISPNYSPGSSNAAASGQNYRCSYSLEVVLLHGGEGWEVGDTVRIIPEHASTANSSDGQAYIDVSVVEVEDTDVKATVSSNGDGLIRPSPTPFDADTAVTAEAVLGSLQTKISNQLSGAGINTKVIGTGLYLFSANPFTVEVMEDDIMRVFQKTVNDVSRLPVQCRHGYIVKVSNARISDEDDYYLRFEGENNLDGTGSWVECAKPGIHKSLDSATMPLVIQRTNITNQNTTTEIATFTIKTYKYADRAVGDETTNPLPTFVGKPINKVIFFRNRLAFLAGENVILSRPGSFGQPDFFAESALAVGANDAIDIACGSTFPSELFDGIEVNSGLLVFSTNQQFLLSSDAEILNPETAKLRSISTYNYNKDISPISMGVTIGYVDNSGKFSRFNEVANIRREGEPDVVEPSKIVPTLLKKDIDLLTNSRENSIILFGKTTSRDVLGFRYFNIGDKRQQQAWFKWTFNNGLRYHFIVNDDYYFLDQDGFLQTLSLVEDDDDVSITQDSVDYLIHLDNYTTLAAGTYDSATNLTTFTNKATWIPDVTPVSPVPNKLVVIDVDSSATRVGRYAEVTLLGNNPNDDFTLPGNWSTGTFYIGYLYDYQVDFPTIYPTQIQGEKSNTDVSGTLVLHRLRVHLGKVGLYQTTLTRLGKDPYTEIYESNELDEYQVSDAPYVEEVIRTVPVYEKNINLDFTLKSTHPSPATLRALSWEGSFTPKYYKRV